MSQTLDQVCRSIILCDLDIPNKSAGLVQKSAIS